MIYITFVHFCFLMIDGRSWCRNSTHQRIHERRSQKIWIWEQSRTRILQYALKTIITAKNNKSKKKQQHKQRNVLCIWPWFQMRGCLKWTNENNGDVNIFFYCRKDEKCECENVNILSPCKIWGGTLCGTLKGHQRWWMDYYGNRYCFSWIQQFTGLWFGLNYYRGAWHNVAFPVIF